MQDRALTADDHPEPGASAPTAGRIDSFDLLRGSIMALMALDHAAFFVAKRHPGEFWHTALPVYLDLISFFTRAVTHLCAPGFFLLMGAGVVFFQCSRQASGWSQRSSVCWPT